MSMNAKKLIMVIACTAGLSIGNAYSAEFSAYQDATGDPTVMMKGPIEEGDFERLAAYLNGNPAAFLFFFMKGLYLDSPGGDVREALKIASFIEQNFIDTIVESGSTCASSCFLIFSAGSRRVMKQGAKIGVHRITLSAYELDIAKTESIVQPTAENVEKYLRRTGMPSRVLEKMNETPASSVYWVTFDWLLNEGILSAFEFRPSFIDVAAKKCGPDPIDVAIRTKIFTDLVVNRRTWVSCIVNVRLANQTKELLAKADSILRKAVKTSKNK